MKAKVLLAASAAALVLAACNATPTVPSTFRPNAPTLDGVGTMGSSGGFTTDSGGTTDGTQSAAGTGMFGSGGFADTTTTSGDAH